MLRLKLLLFITSGTLLFSSCSNSGTNPDNGEEETEESTTLVKNPNDGATLEGEITFSVDESGEFDELRIYVDDNLIKTIENPSLPHDYTLTTYNHDNGDHDIIAELDPSDGSTTIKGSVSVTFENYMLEVDTDGYIEYNRKVYNQYYLFISDPSGNVLWSADLKNHPGGMAKLLPPEALENGTPDYFYVTQLYTFNSGMYLDTYGAFEPWDTHLAGESFYSNSGSPSQKQLTLELGNFNTSYQYVNVLADKGYTPSIFIQTFDTLQSTFKYSANAENLIFLMNPTSDLPPRYSWEKSGNFSDPDTLRYDVSNDLTEMTKRGVPCPSNFSLEFYSYTMSISPDTWNNGSVRFPNLPGLSDGCSEEFPMYFPVEGHLFSVGMGTSNFAETNAVYYQYTSEFPQDFKPLDAEFNISSNSLDNMQFDISGSVDYLELHFRDYENGSHYNDWRVYLPDTTKSFVLPNVSDSLDSSVTLYSRNGFDLFRAYLWDDSDYENYQGFLDNLFGSVKYENEAYRYKQIKFQTNNTKIPHKINKNKTQVYERNKIHDSASPLHLQRRWHNRPRY